MKYLSTIIISILFCLRLYAQQSIGCIDSLSLDPQSRCPGEYKPRCGCNNVTYRDECDMRRNGVRTFVDGTCSGYEFDIFPTYNPYYLTFTLVQATPNFSRMFIVDIYGKLWIQTEIAAAASVSFPIDITYLTPGPYIIYVYDTKGTYRWKKFVKSSIE